MVRRTLEYFKWLDATESKPSLEDRVLLKIIGEDNPVVGYWDGGDWCVCTDNLCAFYTSFGEDFRTEVIREFYNSEVTAYMHIDMTLPFNELGEGV